MHRQAWLIPARRALFAGFLLLELFGAWGNYRLVKTTLYSASDSIPAWESRLAPLKKELPASAVVVGYVSDGGEIGMGFYSLDSQIEYVLTQFVLAPTVVAPGTAHEWVIGNFSKANLQSWLDQHPGQFTAMPVSSGFYLLHRSRQP